ncbi:MAG TPA: DUF2497 domain-containing protein [Pseudolabrys sp.]|nr:DUF2497 domain-containing protein [Pseudolabrys sp.]
MSQAAKAQEPSMEEILASIRRIIADDDGGGKAKAAAPQPKPAPAPAPPPKPQPVANTQEDVDAMLADLEPVKAPAPPPAAAKPEPKPEPKPQPKPAPLQAVPDVLVLTEEMAAKPEEPAGFRTIDAGSDVVFSEQAARADDLRPQFDSASSEQLLSSATAAAVDNAFNSLATTILGNNARTLEDLVKDMLRPMLKTWLDDNLPGLVERIVRSEIERVSRGR